MTTNNTPLQSYISFARDRFNAYGPLKSYYNGDFEKFLKHYVNHYGFKDYIEKVLKGRTLSFSDVCYVGQLYMTYGNRASFDIPKILAYLNKHFGVEFDTLEPIYTEEFWFARRETIDTHNSIDTTQ